MNFILFVFNIVKIIRYRNRNGITSCIYDELKKKKIFFFENNNQNM